MELHIRRSDREISLSEWEKYVATDRELEKAETWEGINPITKQKMIIKIPGHVVYKLNKDEILGGFFYNNGMIKSEHTEREVIKKAYQIAEGLNADLYVDDEKIN